jgi:hypothetical protein
VDAGGSSYDWVLYKSFISINNSSSVNHSILSASGTDPDSGSGAFLTPRPGSGIGFSGSRISGPGSWIPDPESRIPDSGSQTHIFESLVTNFWVKSSIILSKLA